MTRRYRDLTNWASKQFNKTVHLTDEAFVLQISKFHFPRWEEEASTSAECQNENESLLGETTKQRGGAKKGFKQTAARTYEEYNDLAQKVAAARASKTSAAWYQKLQQVARTKMIENASKKANKENDKPSNNQEENEQNENAEKTKTFDVAMYACGFELDVEDSLLAMAQKARAQEVADKNDSEQEQL